MIFAVLLLAALSTPLSEQRQVDGEGGGWMTIVLDPLPPPSETESPEFSPEIPTAIPYREKEDIVPSSIETPVEETSTLQDGLSTTVKEVTDNATLGIVGIFVDAANDSLSRYSTAEYSTDTTTDFVEETTVVSTENYTESDVTYGIVDMSENRDIFATEQYSEDQFEGEVDSIVSTTTAEGTVVSEVDSNTTNMPTTSNPYSHWDADSAEQELEMEEGRSAEINSSSNTDDNVVSYDDYGGDTKEAAPSSPTTTVPPYTQRSYILQLAGNSTIVKLRQNDFAKYLKLNLAARLSLEYDNVKVNRVVLEPPKLLVNVSVVTPSGLSSDGAGGGDNVEEEEEEEPLHLMAETNATLLELSGEEYHVVRMLPLRTRPTAPDVEDTDDGPDDLDEAAAVSDRHSDIEFIIFTVLGGACAAVIAVTIVLTAFRYLRRLSEAGVQWLPPWQLRVPHHRMGDAAASPAPPQPPPTVIYSGSFAARAPAWRTEDPIGVPELEMEGGVPVLLLPPPTSLPSSKLQIFNCNAKNLLIPLPTSQRSCAPKDLSQTQEVRVGHDNPNYCG